MLRVLIVDDQPHVLDAMQLLFEMQGNLSVSRATTPEQAESAVRSGGVGVVVQDMNFAQGTTSGEEGVALFHRLRVLDPELPVILMTAWASVDRAVELVKQGADDYLQKPWNDEQLLRRVKNLLTAREQRLPNASAQSSNSNGPNLCGLLFQSAAMQAVVSLALKVAKTDVHALITGPNGAGKEKVAEIIQANSTRRGAPLIRVNAGALPDELFTAELFGAEAGAFTGAKSRRVGRMEAADGGTLFLDEIGNLSMESQAKLLRAVQSGEFERLGSNHTLHSDVRIVAATNVNLAEAIAAGAFREDLYYRLAVIEIEVPPLCQRREDIVPLALAFGQQHAGRRIELNDECQRALLSHDWPGNVRELQNRIQRALLLADTGELRREHFGLERTTQKGGTRSPVPPAGGEEPGDSVASRSPGASNPVGPPSLERAERETIERALLEAGYVVARAAETLGLTRQALYRRMQRLGVKVKRDLSG